MSKEPGEHVVIADLHGSDEAFEDTLFVLNAVDTSGAWIRKGASLTLLGDILADRNEHGLEIVNRIAALRLQIEAAGGELHVVAGNHDIFALEYLSGQALHASSQKAGFRELFRLAMGREPVSVFELMATPVNKDFVAILHGKDEAKPLLDFLSRLKLFHTAEHEDGGKTLFLHAPPCLNVLAMLLSPSPGTLNTSFQDRIRLCLDPAGVYEERFSAASLKDFGSFQWGEWGDCPGTSDPVWTELHRQLSVRRIVCGHRSHEGMQHFGPVEAVALDRKYGIFPKASHPNYWNGPVSGGILNKRGVFVTKGLISSRFHMFFPFSARS